MGLFGGSTKSQTENVPLHKNIVNAWGHGYHGLMGTPFEMYPEQMYAGQDPLQAEALGIQEQYARGLGGMVDPVMSAWQGALQAPDVANNPYVQGMLEQQRDLLNRNLFENLIPGAETGAIAAGQPGGTRQGVMEGIAARGTQEALANAARQTQFDAWGRGLAQQQYALGAAPGMIGLGQMPANILSGVGGARRAEEQLALDEAIQRHQFAQEEPWMRHERFGAGYFPRVAGYGETNVKTSETPSALGVMGQLAGLGLAGAGMYQGFGLGGGSPAVSAYGGRGYGVPNMSPVTYGSTLDAYLNPMLGKL